MKPAAELLHMQQSLAAKVLKTDVRILNFYWESGFYGINQMTGN